MNEFSNKLNLTQGTTPIDLENPLTPWIGDPRDLPLTTRQELVYRYQFLDERVNILAREYRVTPLALEEWIEENEVEIQQLETDEDIANFESHVNATYKDLRVRMSGLVALHSAKAWQSLAVSEEHLLHTLEHATHQAHERAKDGLVDAKTLKSLVDAHGKIFDRQELIRHAIEVPAERDLKTITDGFQKSLEDLFNEIDGSSYKLPSQDNE